MRSTLTNKIFFKGLFALSLIGFTQCTSTSEPEWQKKNQELIAQHNLSVRELSSFQKSIPGQALTSN